MCHSETVFTGVTNGLQTAQSKRRCFRLLLLDLCFSLYYPRNSWSLAFNTLLPTLWFSSFFQLLFPSLSLSPISVQTPPESLFSPLFKLVKVPLSVWLKLFFIVKYHFFPVSDLCLWNHRNLTLHLTVSPVCPISVLHYPLRHLRVVLDYLFSFIFQTITMMFCQFYLLNISWPHSFSSCSHGSPPGLSLPPLLSPGMAF